MQPHVNPGVHPISASNKRINDFFLRVTTEMQVKRATSYLVAKYSGDLTCLSVCHYKLIFTHLYASQLRKLLSPLFTGSLLVYMWWNGSVISIGFGIACFVCFASPMGKTMSSTSGHESQLSFRSQEIPHSCVAGHLTSKLIAVVVYYIVNIVFSSLVVRTLKRKLVVVL